MQTRIYLTEVADADAVAAVHAEHLGTAAPALLMIGVVEFGPPELVVKVEFECMVGSARHRRALAPDDELQRSAGASAAVRVGDEIWISGANVATRSAGLEAEAAY